MLKIAALRDRSIFFSNENHCLDWSADAHNTANAFKWIILSPKSSTTSNFIGIIYIYCLNICIKVYQFDWWWWIFFHSLEFRWMEFDIRFGVHFFSHLLRSFISTYFFHVCVCVCECFNDPVPFFILFNVIGQKNIYKNLPEQFSQMYQP